MRRLIVLAVALILAAAAARAERMALVIGNAEYERAQDLRNPVNDAEDMAAQLSQIGYTVFGGGAHTDVTRDEMLGLMVDFARALEPGDLAVFYFAGHGAEYKGANYLVPANDDRIEFAEDLQNWAFPVERLLEWIGGVPGVTGVVILDACRNMPLRERVATREAGTEGGLERMAPPPGSSMILMYAAAPNQTSSDGEGRNGVFTGALLQALAEDPARRVDDIHYAVADQVRRATLGFQRPWIELGFSGTTPPIFGVAEDGAGPAGAAAPLAQDTVMERYWSVIQDIEDRAVQAVALRDFLEAFPASPYGAEAARLLSNAPGPGAPPTGGAASTAAKPGRGILRSGLPHYGTIDLDRSAVAAPRRLALLAGGYEDAAALGDGCAGYVASYPDYLLNWDPAMGAVDLTVEAGVATTLVVRSPDSAWVCDAGDGAAPRIAVDAAPGPYRIWVGTRDQQDRAPAATLVLEPRATGGLSREINAVPVPDVGLHLPHRAPLPDHSSFEDSRHAD